jgi:hypothetical protein
MIRGFLGELGRDRQQKDCSSLIMQKRPKRRPGIEGKKKYWHRGLELEPELELDQGVREAS